MADAARGVDSGGFLTNSILSKRVHMNCLVIPWRPGSCQASHKNHLFYPFVI